MRLDRLLILGYFVWTALVTALALGLTWLDEVESVKLVLCTLFTGGSFLCFLGYMRYIPPGRFIPALLALLLGKSIAFTFLGVAFFLSSLTEYQPPVDVLLYGIYACFATAGATVAFTGFYVLVGAGLGWIDRSVYKSPWYSRAYHAERFIEEQEDEDDPDAPRN